MYELLIRLYYELDYRKFTLEDLKEMKEILNQFNGKVEEVKLKKIKIGGNKWMKKQWKNIMKKHQKISW